MNNELEYNSLRSQIATLKNYERGQHRKYLPYILKIARTDKFHDRFIIIDDKELYHCGASLKDLGKKCFGINKIENTDIISSIAKIL